MKKILIIERETSSREFLLKLLKKKQVQLFSVEDGVSALEPIKKMSFDLIFSDLNGIKTLDRLEKRPLGTPLIHMRTPDEGPQKNVAGILSKPIKEETVTKLFQELAAPHKPFHIIAESPQMQSILEQVKKIAKSHSNVFIVGESGTGKEVIAGMIHTLSKRSKAPFVKVNCAALPDTLIESDFFGHEKGAFTGAHLRRIGRFERADLGTLLLDEISEIHMSLQAKLLRVIQEQEFERVGGTQMVHVDVRLISTSNQNMKEAISDKRFRKDLYYRLNVIPIYLPSLRQRVEDILPLADFFLNLICERNQIPLKKLSKQAQEKLLSYSWPGNIRELRNVLEHSVALDCSDFIEEEQLFFDDSSFVEEKPKIPKVIDPTPCLTLKEWEKKLILEVLKRHQNNRTKTASELGVSVRTLRNKLKLYQSSK